MAEWVIVFGIGLSLGSFGNNVISHYVNNASFDLLKSTCMCGKGKLSFYELIPLLSFLFLKGKCSKCGVKLYKRYFVVEIISGVLAVISFEKYGLSLELFLYFASFLVMLIIASVDLFQFIIPNFLLVILFGLSLVNLFFIELNIIGNVISAFFLMGVLTAVNIYYSKYKSGEAIGYGDIKYIGVLTLLFPFPLSLFGFWLSALFAIPGFYLLKYFLNSFKDEEKIPFGLFLSVGYIATNLIDNWLVSIYNNYAMSYQ